MPYINIDIDVDDFYRDCSRREKKELADLLTDDDFLPKVKVMGMSPIEGLFNKDLKKIQDVYIQLTQEEIELISKIAKKY